MPCPMNCDCSAEIERPRLTDAERAAIEEAVRWTQLWGGAPNAAAADTLRGLLARLADE